MYSAYHYTSSHQFFFIKRPDSADLVEALKSEYHDDGYLLDNGKYDLAAVRRDFEIVKIKPIDNTRKK